MSETGFVQIYCGDEKGKTTAAIGTAIQAAGQGYQVLIARLLETNNLGEVAGFSRVPNITVLPCGQGFGLSWDMTQAQRKVAALYYDHCPLNARNMAPRADGEKSYDMLVLDEATGAYNLRSVDEIDLVRALKEKPAALEVIPAGRCPLETLRDQTDYITEMAMRRRPYEHGVGVGEGIEYQKINVREYVLAF